MVRKTRRRCLLVMYSFAVHVSRRRHVCPMQSPLGASRLSLRRPRSLVRERSAFASCMSWQIEWYPSQHVSYRHSSIAALVDAAPTEAMDHGDAPPRTASRLFQVHSKYEPTGDQPFAIEQLCRQLERNQRFSVLQGATGTGKTFVMSHVIARHNKPTLILVHNKTLAAQLARELRALLPHNAVELFISAFKSYRPEFYKETSNKYCAKKSTTDADLEALRHIATRSLVTRRDVVVVASVSCIFGLGLPSDYLEASTQLEVEQELEHDFVEDLERMLYEDIGTDHEKFARGTYQWRTSDGADGRRHLLYTVWPPQEGFPLRVELEQLRSGKFRVTGLHQGGPSGMESIEDATIFPARHYVVSEKTLLGAMENIKEELHERVNELLSLNEKDAAARLQKRTMNDLQMIEENGYCKGMENYSRHISGRAVGEPPGTLMDYLGDDWLLMVDESHVTLPQLRTMYRGDQSRKLSLIKHGYRLPSALDNRPLTDYEFWEKVKQTVFVSATPGHRELALSDSPPIEMHIRPTFVQDPEIQVRSPEGQLEDLLREVKTRALANERTLAMVLTKKDAEDLASYLLENEVNTAYIHSGLGTQQRSAALKALQNGDIDCLVGVNLLREGLDLPQCSLVAVFNADADGMFRSHGSLLQIIGRAARNINGTAVFYANRVTASMRKCMEETNRRRERQLAYIQANNVQMISSVGSSILSPFDLLRHKIELELEGSGIIATHRQASSKASRRASVNPQTGNKASIESDHIPSFPGVYFWKDSNDRILYIGKAKNLRSRISSYLTSSAERSRRIKTMLGKAVNVEFEITPSERDALILESKLIKHHQPPYNVLLKDDNHYPYICARVGDKIPQFSVVASKDETLSLTRQYRYFGPYTSYQEINSILHEIEERYDLRGQSFLVRYSNGPIEEYLNLFQLALREIFIEGSDQAFQAKRAEYEEAGQLFESEFNESRDVVVAMRFGEEGQSALVQVIQLRRGIIARRFSYMCKLPMEAASEEDLGEAIQNVLEKRHYRSGQEAVGGFSFFPDELLLSHAPVDIKSLQAEIDNSRKSLEPARKRRVVIQTPAFSGQRAAADARAIDFALRNARQHILDLQRKSDTPAQKAAAQELSTMMSLEKLPRTIECYDVSHTQGDFPVASRVVFIDGKPVPQLYRTFNIKSVEGVDDYASIQEVIYRRFRRFWSDAESHVLSEDEPWGLPDLVLVDGGVGQLSAALKGMARANIVPGKLTFARSSSAAAPPLAALPIAALAKDQELLFVPGQKDSVNPSSDSPAMLLLRHLRDESHRFALRGHRRRRSILKQRQ